MFIYPDTCRAQLFKFLILVVHMERYLFPLPIYHHQMKKCKILLYVNKTLHFQSRLPFMDLYGFKARISCCHYHMDKGKRHC